MQRRRCKTSGEKETGRKIAHLIDQLGDGNWKRRLDAVEALGALDDPQAVPALINAVTPRNTGWLVRLSAAEALGLIGAPALPLLSVAFKKQNADWSFRHTIALALANIGAPAIPALSEALQDENTIKEAAKALGIIGDPRAVPALIQALKKEEIDWSLRSPIVEALIQISFPAVPALVEVLKEKNGDWLVRKAAVKALGTIGGPQAVPALIEALRQAKGDSTGCEAARFLAEIAQRSPTPALRAALPSLRRLRNYDPVFGTAWEQIEAATSAFKDLPLPAAVPPPDARTLPRPAAGTPSNASAVPPVWWTRLRRALGGF